MYMISAWDGAGVVGAYLGGPHPGRSSQYPGWRDSTVMLIPSNNAYVTHNFIHRHGSCYRDASVHPVTRLSGGSYVASHVSVASCAVMSFMRRYHTKCICPSGYADLTVRHCHHARHRDLNRPEDRHSNGKMRENRIVGILEVWIHGNQVHTLTAMDQVRRTEILDALRMKKEKDHCSIATPCKETVNRDIILQT
jgi:hypothetical protein